MPGEGGQQSLGAEGWSWAGGEGEERGGMGMGQEQGTQTGPGSVVWGMGMGETAREAKPESQIRGCWGVGNTPSSLTFEHY